MTAPASIDDTTLLRQGSDALTAPLAEKLLMLSVTQGSYFEFSAVTRRIWELLETPRTLGDLVARLIEEYEVEPEVCRTEVGAVVGRLVSEGLIGID
ncbi:MAG: PqqD family peptide modification chaperone [Pseudomonadota bacterium]